MLGCELEHCFRLLHGYWYHRWYCGFPSELGPTGERQQRFHPNTLRYLQWNVRSYSRPSQHALNAYFRVSLSVLLKVRLNDTTENYGAQMMQFGEERSSKIVPKELNAF
jgi:hypothetical protein